MREADFIQENAPEREELKRDLLARDRRSCAGEALIASSTSGLLPSRLQAGMRGPSRFLVGHPFNPVYLLPLVELCGGGATDPAQAIEAARDFYASLGMHPLRSCARRSTASSPTACSKRCGARRCGSSMTTSRPSREIDDAIRYGAGLRWAFMGTFLTYRLAGGEAGMRHFLAQFGPALKLPWTKLMDVPELTRRLHRRRSPGNRTAGRRRFARKRSSASATIASSPIMQALRAQDFASGKTLAAS